MVSCPFEIPAYDYGNGLTPQMRKCNLCAHLVPDKQEVPSCVKICPAEALTYGKRSDLLSIAHETIRRHPDRYIDHIYGEQEAGGTSWLFLSSVPFEEVGMLEVDHRAPPRLTESIQHGVFKKFGPPLMLYGVLAGIMWLGRGENENPPEPEAEDHDQENCQQESIK